MTEERNANEVQATEKQEVTTPEGVERMTGRRVYSPKVDIFEAEGAITVRADMPGVDETSVDVTLEKNVLTIRAHVDFTPPEGYDLVYREYAVGDYERAFTLSDEVDRDGIEAKIKDGVLYLVLPKASPDNRTIQVQSA